MNGMLIEKHDMSLEDYFINKEFTPKNVIFFENELFIVKTAVNKEEVAEAIRFRTELCNDLNIKSLNNEIKIDKHDITSDHLLIIDKSSNALLGVCRFNSNLFSNSFYVEDKFVIDEVLSLPGIKLEFGRIYIHKEYQNQSVILMFWTGLLLYANKLGVDYIFGCSSVNSQDLQYLAQIYMYFKDNNLISEDIRVATESLNLVANFDLILMEEQISGNRDYSFIEKDLPSYVKLYLSAGAKICSEPIYDAHFNCFEFFTLFDIKNIELSDILQY